MTANGIRDLTFRHHASYIQDRPTATTQSALFYIFNQQIYYLIIFFRLSPTIFVYSFTRCRVLPNVTLLGS